MQPQKEQLLKIILNALDNHHSTNVKNNSSASKTTIRYTRRRYYKE